MIAGLGIDLVEIERVRGVLERQGDRFLTRLLHPDESPERIQKADGVTHLAGLFAAKEAVMKALGTGMAGAAFQEIAIHHDDAGRPLVALSGGAASRAALLGVRSWHISITHTATTAGAVAVAVKG